MKLQIFGIDAGDPDLCDIEEAGDMEAAARSVFALVSDDIVFSSDAIIEMIRDIRKGMSGVLYPAAPSAANSGTEIAVDGDTWTISISSAYIDENDEVSGHDHVRWSGVFEAVTEDQFTTDAMDLETVIVVNGDGDALLRKDAVHDFRITRHFNK